MKLARRLWLFGALLPAAATLAALLVAGEAFRYELHASLDRALLAQAAVESVSLFDGPNGRPHLHMSTSPLEEQVRPFAPTGWLFGPDGELVMRYPEGPEQSPPERQLPQKSGVPATLRTVEQPDGTRRRELSLSLLAPGGDPYLLRLSASLAQLDASVSTFRRVTLSFAVLLALGLLGLQSWQARRLSSRLLSLARHLARLREGALDQPPPADPTRDEVAALRDVLAEATEKLRAARETQERLVADAAHELRTPLTLMRTSLDLALRRNRDPCELRQALEDTRDEVDRLAALSSRLLDLAALGRDAWDRKAGDLRRVVDDAVEASRGAAESKGVLMTVAGLEQAPAAFHESSVRQAVDNLLSNALKFAPRGSTVTVAVDARDSTWEISVVDEGPGIPAAERDAVFAPFHRVPGSAGGTGLGLAIVREIARRHGGDAAVAHRATPGLCVTIALPQG